MSEIEKAVLKERARCAAIADARAEDDRKRYATESDWRMPYAFNRVVRASMDISAAIRKPDPAGPKQYTVAEHMVAVERMVKKAEDNGWNAAINACHEILPPNWNQHIKRLYRP